MSDQQLYQVNRPDGVRSKPNGYLKIREMYERGSIPHGSTVQKVGSTFAIAIDVFLAGGADQSEMRRAATVLETNVVRQPLPTLEERRPVQRIRANSPQEHGPVAARTGHLRFMVVLTVIWPIAMFVLFCCIVASFPPVAEIGGGQYHAVNSDGYPYIGNLAARNATILSTAFFIGCGLPTAVYGFAMLVTFLLHLISKSSANVRHH